MRARRLLLTSGLILIALLAWRVGWWQVETPPLVAGGRWNLLLRSPDRVVEQTGRLRPIEVDPWGAHGPFGWEARRSQSFRGRQIEHVFGRQPSAHLRLSTGRPRDREIRITAWVAARGADGGERPCTVRLNGVEIGRPGLVDEPRTIELEAPEALWVRGDNVLELSVDELVAHPDDPSGERMVGVAVAAVDYDEPQAVEVDALAGRIRLKASTGVTYDVEALSPLRLSLGARARGAGTLQVRAHRVAPGTGEETALELSLDVDLHDQAVQRVLPLPDVRPDLLSLDVDWRSDGGSTLALEELSLLEEPGVERPPVVFISIDTLSAARTSVLGNARRTTPCLEELAAESIVFERCETNAPWTLPSYMSVMTGLYAQSHLLPEGPKGWSRLNLWERWYLAENRWTLAEMLRAAGYRTAGFVDNSWIVARHGFPQGFETYDWSAALKSEWDPEGGIRRTARLAEEWLSHLPPRAPFFLFVHGFDVHAPYAPPPPFRGRFHDSARAEAGPTAPAGGVTNSYGIVPAYVSEIVAGQGEPIPEHVATDPIEASYDEGVLMVDDAVGRFLDRLKELGIYDRAILIVHADHGETMDDTPFYFGHGVLDEEVMHVPLLVRLPGGRGGGLRVSHTVQSVDVYPTVMELVGIASEREYLHGRSLVPALEGRPLPPAPTLCESGVMRQAALVYDGWKLVRFDPGRDSGPEVLLTHPSRSPEVVARLAARGIDEDWTRGAFARIDERGLTPELLAALLEDERGETLLSTLRRSYHEELRLYDLESDPGEDVDLAAAEPGRVAELTKLLEHEVRRRDEAAAEARPPTRPVEFSGEDLERLRAVGYAGESPEERAPRDQ